MINQVKIFIKAKRNEVKEADEGWLRELDLVTLNHPDIDGRIYAWTIHILLLWYCARVRYFVFTLA